MTNVCAIYSKASAVVDAVSDLKNHFASSPDSKEPVIVHLPAGSNRFHTLRIKGKVVVYKNSIYDVTDTEDPDTLRNLVLASELQERRIAENAAEEVKRSQSPPAMGGREHIPVAVRREVWRRDMGRCTQCTSPERLEFDHIIPVAKGGSNTVRNIQLLCEPCNRRKSAMI